MSRAATLPPPSIPATVAELLTVTARDGLGLRLYRLRRGCADAPVLLWGHANGFSAGSYLPLLEELCDDFQVFAFDARGHGGSQQPPLPFDETLHIDRYTSDLGLHVARVREIVGDRPMFFSAHSFSGVAALRLGAIEGVAPWRAVVLFEPPLVPTADHPEYAIAASTGRDLIAGAARRRRRWVDPATYAASLGKRIPYSQFRPDMLQAHCSATLRPTADGDFELACAPEVEMATYQAVDNVTTFEALPRFPSPVHFVASEPAVPPAPPSWAALVQEIAAARVTGAQLTRLDGTGHMMPFEKPAACRQILLETLINFS